MGGPEVDEHHIEYLTCCVEDRECGRRTGRSGGLRVPRAVGQERKASGGRQGRCELCRVEAAQDLGQVRPSHAGSILSSESQVQATSGGIPIDEDRGEPVSARAVRQPAAEGAGTGSADTAHHPDDRPEADRVLEPAEVLGEPPCALRQDGNPTGMEAGGSRPHEVLLAGQPDEDDADTGGHPLMRATGRHEKNRWLMLQCRLDGVGGGQGDPCGRADAGCFVVQLLGAADEHHRTPTGSLLRTRCPEPFLRHASMLASADPLRRRRRA